MAHICNTFTSWIRWLACCPPTASIDEVNFPPEGSAAYITYLGKDRFTAGIDSAIPREKAERLASLIAKPSSCTRSRTLCCSGRHMPYGLRVCCSSTDARCAMAAGYCLGNVSAQFASFLTITPWIVNIISGCFSGTANCSGTWFALIDTTRRDDKQDIHSAIERFFENLGLYLIQQHMGERKQKMERGEASPHLTTYTAHAENLRINRAELERSIRKYFPDYEEEDTDVVILRPIFEVVDYILDGTIPANSLIRNEITTTDSPSLEDHLRLRREVLTLREIVETLRTEIASLRESATAPRLADTGAGKEDV